MDSFCELDTSIFDPNFTLRPLDFLEPLYARREYLGFRSEGMNFLFRLHQCRQVMFSRDCGRVAGDSVQAELEHAYAEHYPNNAWYYQQSYTHGESDLAFKGAVGRFIAEVAECADFAQVEPVCAQLSSAQLSQGGVANDFVADLARLPLRIFLNACRLPFDEAQLAALQKAGSSFVQGSENYHDDTMHQLREDAIGVIRTYVEAHYNQIDSASPLANLIAAGHASGLDDDFLVANVAGNFITAISSTLGVSAPLVLRSLINDPHTLARLKADPTLAREPQVITELLRRDSHVKSQSRQLNVAMDIDGFHLPEGSRVFLFFPGINMDPTYWQNPRAIDFRRDFSAEGNVVFGGSQFTCIGKALTMAFMGNTIALLVRHLPVNAQVLEERIEVDGSWLSERIITRMPIDLG